MLTASFPLGVSLDTKTNSLKSKRLLNAINIILEGSVS
jgi:hypothetical protein